MAGRRAPPDGDGGEDKKVDNCGGGGDDDGDGDGGGCGGAIGRKSSRQYFVYGH